jgi:hypothetical protein
MLSGKHRKGDRSPARLPLRVVLVGLATWALFGLAWWRVIALHAQVGPNVLMAVLASALTVLSTDLWWVRHNRRIYRDKGPRRGQPARAFDYATDGLGRPVRLLVTDGCPAEVELDITPAGEKVYRAVG